MAGVAHWRIWKLGAEVGITNLCIDTAVHGQSLVDYLNTRNTQALYSVAT